MEFLKMKSSYTRREFIKRSTQLASGILLTASLPAVACGKKEPVVKTKVGLTRSPNLWTGEHLNQDILCSMLDEGLKCTSGYDNPSKAWQSLFTRNDIVALKVNCIGKEVGSTKPELSHAIAKCLKSYVGIPYENIIIFDRYNKELIRAGYTINTSNKGIQIHATSDFSPPIRSGGIDMGLSTIITKKCTALINVPLLKTHRGAKLTLNLKNHYGSIPMKVVQNSELKFHSNNFQNIVFANALSPIKEKTRLCIADGIVAQYDKGPMGNPDCQWNFNGIIVGKDPVAVDTVGLKIINEKRIEKNLKSYNVKYLRWAEEEGLGINNLDSIELIQKTI